MTMKITDFPEKAQQTVNQILVKAAERKAQKEKGATA